MIKITDFWAQWCGPCRQLNPILVEINDLYPDIVLEKIDLTTKEGRKLAAEKGIKAIPHIEIEKDGILVEKFSGFKNKTKLIELIEKYV